MMNRIFIFLLLGFSWSLGPVYSKQVYIHEVTDEVRREQLTEEARVERMVQMPMRDGVRLATSIYFPKHLKTSMPTIFWRTPYNVSELSKGNPERPSAELKFALDAVRHGYVFVLQNERGRYFSEGEWEILGFPRTDGYDALSWIEKQSWSNGKVATGGCSSTAEWQLALAAMGHPAHAAAVSMAYGAGVGRVGEFYEQGNMYRGGAIQQSMVTWMFVNQNTQRPVFPKSLSREDLIRLAKYTDLEVQAPSPDWGKALWYLPMSEMYAAYAGPKGAWNEMAMRHPDDPAWYQGGLYHDNEDYKVPTLWVSSWYDLSTAPNLEIVNHVIANASDKWVRDQQYIIVAPTKHCEQYRLRNPLIVGERDMGDVGAELRFDETFWDFLDFYTLNKKNGFKKKYAKVRYFTMGSNEWHDAESWPPKNINYITYYLDSKKGANSLNGDGRLVRERVDSGFDEIIYDPLNPVPSLGGNLWGDIAGSFDNKTIEMRGDVLVYTTDKFVENIEVTGKIKITLFVSSDAKDTDFTVKLLDVYPDGRAFNLDETIQRVRYRQGYDREVFMEEGAVYELTVSPITTSNVFLAEHRLRIEISSSNFPRFQRNLNTGENNFTGKKTVVARNRVHHTENYTSRIEVPVVVYKKQK